MKTGGSSRETSRSWFNHNSTLSQNHSMSIHHPTRIVMQHDAAYYHVIVSQSNADRYRIMSTNSSPIRYLNERHADREQGDIFNRASCHVPEELRRRIVDVRRSSQLLEDGQSDAGQRADAVLRGGHRPEKALLAAVLAVRPHTPRRGKIVRFCHHLGNGRGRTSRY